MAQDKLVIIEDGDKPNTVIDVPKGMDKDDLIFTKTIGALREHSRNIETAVTKAVAAQDSADDAHGRIDTVETQMDFDRGVSKGRNTTLTIVISVIGVSAGMIALLSKLGVI